MFFFAPGFSAVVHSPGFWGESIIPVWTSDVPAYEVWSGFPFAGGRLLESHPDIRDVRIAFDVHGSAESLTFRYPASSNAASATKEGRVFCRRVKTKDGQGTNRTSYWIIGKKIPQLDTNGNNWVRVECLPASSILADYLVEETNSETGFVNGDITQADSTLAEHVASSLLSEDPLKRVLPWWIVAGDIEPPDRFTFGTSDATAGEWCVAAAKQAGCEFRFRLLDDETGFALDFVWQIGAGKPKVYVETGKNVADIEKTYDYLGAATHVRGFDAEGRKLEHNAWIIETILSGGDWGDVNNSGTVNIIDAQQVARYIAGLSVANLNALIQRGDVTGDGRIDTDDSTAIAQFAVGGSGFVDDPVAAARIDAACTQILFVLVDPLGRTIDAVPVRGTLNGYYLTRDQATYSDEAIVRSHEPHATVANKSYVLVEDDTGFAEDDTTVIREGTGAAGKKLTLLHNPTPIEDGITRRLGRFPRTNISATRNLVPNPFFSTWTGDPDDPPDGFSLLITSGSPTIERVDDPEFVLYGDYAVRIRGGAPNISSVTFLTSLLYPWERGADGLASVRARVILVTPAQLSEILLVVYDHTDTIVPGSFGANAGIGGVSGGTEILLPGEYDLIATGFDPSALATGYKIGIFFTTTTSSVDNNFDAYIDAMQVTPGGADPGVFLEGPETNLLYNFVGLQLIARAPSVIYYKIKVADLARQTNSDHPEDEINIGADVQFVAPEVDNDEPLRVMRYVLNDDNPIDSELEVASQKQRMTDLLARAAAATLQLDMAGMSQRLAREIRKTSFSTLPAITVAIKDADGALTGDMAEVPQNMIGNALADIVTAAGKRLLKPPSAA